MARGLFRAVASKQQRAQQVREAAIATSTALGSPLKGRYKIHRLLSHEVLAACCNLLHAKTAPSRLVAVRSCHQDVVVEILLNVFPMSDLSKSPIACSGPENFCQSAVDGF